LASLSARKAIAISALCLFWANAGGQESICYYDDNNVFKCGDSVPPEDARHDRVIRNSQGVTIREEQGEITPEEQAEIDRQRREEEARLAEQEERARYDQMLLDTYLTIEAIESLRDRRLEIIESQIHITEIILRNLERKLESLKNDAERFAPYSERDDAPPIPDNLSIDIDRTESAISLREAQLSDIRSSQEEIRQDFQRDIDRFRELKGEPVPDSNDSSARNNL
jgi:hypothetical protein